MLHTTFETHAVTSKIIVGLVVGIASNLGHWGTFRPTLIFHTLILVDLTYPFSDLDRFSFRIIMIQFHKIASILPGPVNGFKFTQRSKSRQLARSF